MKRIRMVVCCAGLAALISGCGPDIEITLTTEDSTLFPNQRFAVAADVRNAEPPVFYGWSSTCDEHFSQCTSCTRVSGTATVPPGTCTVSLFVKDGRDESAQSTLVFHVLARPANRPPTILEFTFTSGTVRVNQSVSLSVRATDPEGRVLTYQWVSLPASLPARIEGLGSSIAWTPLAAGTYTVHVTVLDEERAGTPAFATFVVVP